jgi:hypothetical protein
METKAIAEKEKNRFYFDFLNPNRELETRSNLKLLHLLTLAPPGAKGFGWVENNKGGNYLCTISIFSPFRSFTAKALGSSPEGTVNRALDRMEDELFRWRFGSGSGDQGREIGFPGTSPATTGTLRSTEFPDMSDNRARKSVIRGPHESRLSMPAA